MLSHTTPILLHKIVLQHCLIRNPFSWVVCPVLQDTTWPDFEDGWAALEPSWRLGAVLKIIELKFENLTYLDLDFHLLTLLGLTPCEFLIGLSLCLRGTDQESQVWRHQKLKNHVILPAGIIPNWFEPFLEYFFHRLKKICENLKIYLKIAKNKQNFHIF